MSAMAVVAKLGDSYLKDIELPTFQTIQEAESFKLELAQREFRGEVSHRAVVIAYERVDNWIDDQRADAASARADAELELKRLAADQSTVPQTIRIEGGLPALPGTNITMPHLNGAHVDGLLLPPTDSINGHGSHPAPQPSTQAPEPKVQRYYLGLPVEDPSS
jgi:hypothetical protein